VEILGILPDNVHQMDKSKLGFQWCKGNSSIRGKGMKQRRNLHTWLSNCTKTLKKGIFLLDGAATSHMVDEFIYLESERPVDVMVKGLGEMKAVGKGMLIIQGVALGEALRVPGLGVNLISEGVMQQRGCSVVSQNDWRKIYDGSCILIQAKLMRGLFVWRPEGVRLVEQCFLAGSKPSSSLDLWHLRMGHLNKRSLMVLRNISTGMGPIKGGDLQYCVSCCRSKLAQRSFKGNNDKAIFPYHTIYVDIWGPMQQFIEGSNYALLIVDEYSSYTWGKYLQHKSQAAEYIMTFVKEKERNGDRVAKIRSDQGGEFSSGVLRSFLSERGIIHAQSPAYTPQFQGKVERMNRTVGEMAHAMRVGPVLVCSSGLWLGQLLCI
jgi:hypothetical protein